MEKVIVPAPSGGSEIEVSVDWTISLMQMEERVAEHMIVMVCEDQARGVVAAIRKAAKELGWRV